jgi:hypothetical protein
MAGCLAVSGSAFSNLYGMENAKDSAIISRWILSAKIQT